MRKEVLLAIFAGSFLGLIIAFGIWRANSSFKPKGGNSPAGGLQASATPTPSSDFRVVIAKPLNNQVIPESSVAITGATKANSYMAVSGEARDNFKLVSASGDFEVATDLKGGVNQIEVFAFDETGAAAAANLTLVYSTEFAKAAETKTDEKTATDEVRQKVLDKVSQASNPPTALYGTITDITDSTFQIKPASGTIQQISINKDETTFVKVSSTSKEIKFSEVAIGDYIVALGYKNGNGLIKAERILVTSPIVASGRKAIMGEVSQTGKQIAIKNPKTGETTNIAPTSSIRLISLDPKIKISRFSDIKAGDTIIAVGTTPKEVLEARSILVLKVAPKE